MVTIHKSDKTIAPVIQATPEMIALIAKGPVKIDAIHAALDATYAHFANMALTLDPDHPAQEHIKLAHQEMYGIETILDEQNNLFLGAEESIDPKVVAL